MKITFVSYNIYGVGGTVRTTVNLANELAARDWEVAIISARRTQARPALGLSRSVRLEPLVDVRGSSDRSPFAERLRRLDRRTSSVLMHRHDDLYDGYSWLSDARLLRALRRERDTVLVTTTPSLNLAASRVLRPSVLHIGQEHKAVDAHHPALLRDIRRRYADLGALHCVSRDGARYYRDLLEGTGTPVAHIPNGTVLPEPPSPSEPETPRERLVVAAGHLAPHKALHRAIEAFARVVEPESEWRFEIYGAGPEAAALRTQVLDLGMHNHVFLRGKTTRLPEVLQRSAVYLLPSEHESFGMVLVEAMGAGVPCVAFESDGPRMLIEDGVDGYLVAQDDADGFAARLEDLMENEPLRRTMGERARRSATQYGMAAIADRWEEWLGSLMESSP